MLVGVGGAGAFAKVNVFLFVTLITAISLSFGSLLFGSEREIEHLSADLGNNTHSCHGADIDLNDKAYNISYYRPSAEKFRENLYPRWDSTNNLVVVLSIIFTSTCGVMEGANLSGDLKDPAKSLPKGTLYAKCTSFTTYIIFATLLAACFDRQAMKCEYLIVQYATIGSVHDYAGIPVVIGIAMACLSTSLGALFGAARILQAIARDSIFWGFGPWGKGTLKGDEPQRALLLTYVLSQIFYYVVRPKPGGDSSATTNAIAAILTDFFLTAYAFVNLSQLLLSLSGAPNYRPTFKWCSWWTSLIGFVSSMFLMWYLSWKFAAATCGMWLTFFIGIKLTAGERDWGDITQALLFRGVVSRLKDLAQRKDSSKFWRSSILVLAQDLDLPLLTFCKHMTKDGLFIIGTALVPNQQQNFEGRGRKRTLTQSMLPKFSNPVAVTKAVWLWIIETFELGGLITVAKGSELLQTFTTMVSCAGLGGLSPNTVVIPYKDSVMPMKAADYVTRIDEQLRSASTDEGIEKLDPGRRADKKRFAAAVGECSAAWNHSIGLHKNVDYVKLLQSVIALEKNLMIVRNLSQMNPLFHGIRQGHKLTPTTIDVWIVGDWDLENLDENVALQIQHAHLMKTALGKRAKLRILQLVHFLSQEQGTFHRRLKDLVEAARIDMPEMIVLPAPSRPSTPERRRTSSSGAMSTELSGSINQIIKAHSANTTLAMLALPPLPLDITQQSADAFVESLHKLTDELPPTALMLKGEPDAVISTHI